MPHEWLPPDDTGERLRLWPYRSLPRKVFVIFVGGTATLLAVPLFVALGSPVLWALLPFLLGAVAAVWWALERSYRDAEIVEDLRLTAEHLHLTRHGPKGRRQEWQANPHWVKVTLHPTGGPVPDYLTLSGGDREVELGAFLTPPERAQLAAELRSRLARLRSLRP